MKYLDIIMEDVVSTDDKMCRFDGGWDAFVNRVKQLPENCTTEDACRACGIDLGFYDQTIHSSISSWRDATTKSTLQGIAGIRPGELPKDGSVIFTDYLRQTRFLMVAFKSGLLPLGAIRRVRQDGKFVRITFDAHAMTTNDADGDKAVNDVLRVLYLYVYLNSRKRVKLPRMIYRGVRLNDLFAKEAVASAMTSIQTSGHYQTRKAKTDIIKQYICDHGLNSLSEGQALSFTSSLQVAEYFADKRGLVIRVDPQKVEIISSELHDERLAGRDEVSGRLEREWIIRIPDEYVLVPDNIIIHDEDYFLATYDPMVVGFLSHDTKRVTYTMNGNHIQAKFSWDSPTKGRLLFRDSNDPYRMLSQKEWKRKYGFDPVPNKSNRDQITDLKIETGDHWSDKWRSFKAE